MNAHAKINTLKHAELFDELSAAALEKIASNSYFENFNKGEIVFREGETIQGIHIIRSGKAKGYKTSPEGRKQILRIVESGDIVAEAALFEDKKNYPVTLEIIEKSEILLVPGDFFINFLKNNPEAALQLIGVLSKRLRKLVKMVEELSLKAVSARIAKYLLDRAVDTGENIQPQQAITLSITKNEMASAVGTIPETLSRTLKKMDEKEIIDNQRQKIIIKKPLKLQEIAAGKKD
ncbi:MAG: Crp/Fnr family transcriptional regulator [bacterium]